MNDNGRPGHRLKDGRYLRCGYTTGTCAAAAAAAAAEMLLTQKPVSTVRIRTPKGIELLLEIEQAAAGEDWASCAVVKDSGDDPDVTNGIRIHARVCRQPEKQITITGGQGIGRVTQRGLSVDVGEAAINPVPRKMIEAELIRVCDRHDYAGGLACEIYAPEGERIARRTFNEKLGIQGGISILGTSGIVEPMSEEALKETLYLELNVLREKGWTQLMMFPGNYAQDFARGTFGLEGKNAIKYGNYTGYVLDIAADKGFTEILMIGHIGKLIKNAGGIMQTHSSLGDGRMEIFCCHCALCGIGPAVLRRIMECATTDAVIEILQPTGRQEQVFQAVADAVQRKAAARLRDRARVECVVFSQRFGLLSMSEGARRMIEEAGGKVRWPK